LQGWYGSVEAFKRDPINYGVKAMMYTVIPKTLAVLAKKHMLTELLNNMGTPDAIMELAEWYEESMNAIPDYYKARYDAIPMPIRTHDGRQYYLPIPRSFEMQFVGEAYYNLIDGIVNGKWDGDANEIATQAKNTIGGTLGALFAANPASGGLTPWLKVTSGWGAYAVGQNPFDKFYGRNVIPRGTYGRDVVKELGIMGRWTYKTVGGQLFWILPKESDMSDEEKVLIQRMYGIPLIGNPLTAVLRVSDEPVR
jgi:hypothetical protein